METAIFRFLVLQLFCSAITFASGQNIRVYFNNDETKSYVDPYRNIEKPGANFEKIMISFIDRAKDSVVVAVQEFNLSLLAKALVRAKMRGVKVGVIVEDLYNRSFSRISHKEFEMLNPHLRGKVMEQLRFIDNNPTAKARKDIKISNEEILDRDAISILKRGGVTVKDDSNGNQKTRKLMHHKFVVVDDRVSLVSSANFTRSGIHGDFGNNRSHGNANALIIFNSKGISNHFVSEFSLMWSGKFKKKKPYRGVKGFKLDGGAIGIQFSPTDPTNHSWEQSTNGTIAKEVRKSKREFVSNLFNFTSQGISNALEQAKIANPNLTIEVLVDPLFATRFYSSMLDLWGLKMRNPETCEYQEGNRPWRKKEKSSGKPILNSGDKLHHKFAVIDRHTVIFGSHNWSTSGNIDNDETLMIIRNKDVAREFVREHDRIFRRANLGPKPALIEKIKEIERRCR